MTKDIYYKVDIKIMDRGFYESDIQTKKALIEEGLFNYTVTKLKELGITDICCDKKQNDLISMLEYVDSRIIDLKEKDDFFSNYTHYILNVAGGIQGFGIVWYQSNDNDLLEQPLIDFNIDGKWDSLKTHQNTSPIQTTLFVLDVFKNQLCIENKSNCKIKHIN